jgi:hypothetical protein
MSKIENFRIGVPGSPVWRCFSCGRVMKSRISLYGHLHHCYWYQSVFKTHIEDAPFYVKLTSKQLRYYRRNRGKVNAHRRNKYKMDKIVGSGVVAIPKIRRSSFKLPATLRNHKGE